MTRTARVALLGALLVAACGAPRDGSEGQGRKTSALELPNTGLIPYPVQVDNNGGTAIRSFDSMASGNGGALGDRLARAFATLPSDWSRPAYDGFGLRTDWVPPTDPALYGGSAGTDAVSFYLAAAKGAAEEATSAVQTSITALLQQQSDATVAAAANQQA